jgi:hypothetical protein
MSGKWIVLGAVIVILAIVGGMICARLKGRESSSGTWAT